jgi:hypothetical protein
MRKKREFGSKDLLIMLLYVPGRNGMIGESIIGRTRLMKMVFLFERELYRKFRFDKVIRKEDMPEFDPYDYGPFSKTVYGDLDFLINLGYVIAETETDKKEIDDEAEAFGHWSGLVATDEGGNTPDSYVPQRFTLTNLGRGFAKDRLRDRLSDNQYEALCSFKAACTKATLIQILAYVYNKYQDMTARSKILDKVKGELRTQPGAFSF